MRANYIYIYFVRKRTSRQTISECMNPMTTCMYEKREFDCVYMKKNVHNTRVYLRVYERMASLTLDFVEFQ